MKKVSMSGKSNSFCPQPTFLYGTYKDDGTPNFGLFCWFSYYWDGELGIMCCIGGEKMTKDNIRRTKVFSANLVNAALLPLADYLGNTEGYAPGKMDVPINVEKGETLEVPTLADSPWTYELEVERAIPLDDGDVFLCRIRNVQAMEELLDEGKSPDERLALADPVITFGTHRYYPVAPKALGAWGEWKAFKG